MKILEIQTDNKDNGDWTNEWLVITLEEFAQDQERLIKFSHEYLSPRTGDRQSWHDSGSNFNIKHLDTVIDALIKARDSLKENI